MNDPIQIQLKRARASLFRAGLVLTLQSAVLVALPWPLKLVFDTLARGASGPVGLWLSDHLALPVAPLNLELTAEGLSFLGLAAIAAFFSSFEPASTARVALEIVNRLRRELLLQLLHGRLTYIESHAPQELADRVSHDTLAIEGVLVAGLRSAARAAPSLMILLGTLFVLDLRLAVVFIVAIIPFYLVAASLARRSRVHRKRALQEADHFRNEITRTLKLIAGVKSMTVENSALEALEARSQSAIDHETDSRRAVGTLFASMISMKSTMRALVAVIGGVSVLQGEISFGTLALIFAYIENVDGSMLEIGRFMSKLRTVSPALERVRSLSRDLDREEETEGSRQTSSLPFPDADVVHIKDLVLETASEPFSAEFEPGELIAVVGPSGSGKSRFGRTLNRLNDPLFGQISIGRTDIKRYRLELLRSTVTFVDRKPFFLRTTLRDNLRITSATDADIDDQYLSEALHAAAVDFIGDLPEKLETMIGEGAYQLTREQDAKLNIARAFLRSESRVFFFDEPTADLDPESARIVFESVHLLAERGAVVFWVTRRLDEAAESDRVIFFPSAKYTSPRIDSHDALLANEEAYRRAFGLRERASRPPREPSAQRSKKRSPTPENTR